ncbi:hypothetical protein GF402_01275 [Candidatus Fermentibacteria bacterium]|nr:hypothetical protein [Candidatus Fermentibacteria bacterium]
MEKKRLTIFVIALVGMLGTFLPWAKIGPVTASGTGADGWYTFVLFAIGGAIAFFLGDRSTPISKGALTGVWITAVIAFVVGIIDFFDVSGSPASVGFGLILVVLAAIAQVLVAFLMKDREGAEEAVRPQAQPARPEPSATPEQPAEPAAPAPGTAPRPERPTTTPKETPSSPPPPEPKPREQGEESESDAEEEEEDDTRSYE